MKTFSKIIAALISAFVILTCALPAVNAAQKPPCPQIEVIRSTVDRSDPQWLIDKICADHGICFDEILKYVNRKRINDKKVCRSTSLHTFCISSEI